MYKIEGFNTTTSEWEDMPYQLEVGGLEHVEIPIEYMAKTMLAHWQEFCPGDKFRIVEV